MLIGYLIKHTKNFENNPALREKISEHLATDEQLELLKNLGIKPDKYLSKIEAYRTIKNSKTPR
jgi:hypothetical protein